MKIRNTILSFCMFFFANMIAFAQSNLAEYIEKVDSSNVGFIWEISRHAPSFLDTVLLAERNKMWLPTIINNIKENPCLFVVGAKHLMGRDYSLLTLLRNEGYLVKPVCTKE